MVLCYLVQQFFYKRISIKSLVYSSVRVEGKKYISIGKSSTVQRQGWLLAMKIDSNEPNLTIGDRCAIGDSCHIAAVREVIIEDDVLMANKIYIADNVHEFEDISSPIIAQPVKFKGTVRIKSGSWLGENVCVIGANIGRNSVIGANSVVTKDIPDYSVAVGSPARIIKQYDHKIKAWIKV